MEGHYTAAERVGHVVGFTFSYLLSSTIFFAVFGMWRKHFAVTPLNFLYVAAGVGVVALTGYGVRRWLQ